MINYINRAKNALKKSKKSTDKRGVRTSYNYSSFWMNDKWDANDKFSGLNTSTAYSANSDTVKLIKLANYRRAITNFVKIVTNKDLPVLWAGNESFTNGEAINISTNIKDNNFDVTVGLALHEASHCILTDFKIFKAMGNGDCAVYNDIMTKHGNNHISVGLVKSLLNWVEDRRIDHYIFSTSPGYKAYYHKLYDYYWNNKEIVKGFLSTDYADPACVDSWLFHIINIMNPSFNSSALPRLQEIVDIIDVRNIARLKSTQDSLGVACSIADIILSEIQKASNAKKDDIKDNKGSNQDENGADVNEDDNDEDSGSSDKIEKTQLNELTPKEKKDIRDAFNKQKDFLEGSTGKKSATRKLQASLDNITSQQIDVQTVGDNKEVSVQSALMYDYVSGSKMAEIESLLNSKQTLEDEKRSLQYSDPRRKEIESRLKEITNELEKLCDKEVMHYDNIFDTYVEALQKGLEMGGLLGKKLQLHNEARERVDTRLRSGTIDAKRLAHAGYGIEGIFKQIHIDKFKKANLHISLDGSGSMSGDKWASTITMCMAIAKAASYTQNINIQVSVRVTKGSSGRGDIPCNLFVYDSRVNKLNQLVSFFKSFSPSSMTPEGLCLEAAFKKGLFIQSDRELDSYFLNISDGQPGCTGYNGRNAQNHTRNWVNRMRNELGISVISFFMEAGTNSRKKNDDDDVIDNIRRYQQLVAQFDNSSAGRSFKNMYGRDASVVDPSNALHIAKELNKKFLSK